MNELIDFISSVGFPIAACIYMARIMRAEMQELTKVISHVGEAIDDLKDRLDRLEANYEQRKR